MKAKATRPTAADRLAFQTAKAFELLDKIRTGLEAVESINDRDSEDVNWGHVGDMAHYVEQLQPLADALYLEGEHAPETDDQRARQADILAAIEVLADVRGALS